MAYYLAASLAQLRTEVNTRWPNRDKRSDGWVGDTSHRARRSDHNPDYRSHPPGVVRAIDIDKDGIDTSWLLARLVRDSRTNYVIWNRRIYDRAYGFRARRYYGENPHTHHMHVSILHGTAAEDSTRPWLATTPTKPPTPEPPGDDMPIDANDAERIARAIWVYDSPIDENPSTYSINLSSFRALNEIRTQNEQIIALLKQIAAKP